MTATLLDSPAVAVSSTYPTISAGSNRKAFVAVCTRQTGGVATAAETATIGGVAATRVCGGEIGVATERVAVALFAINNSDISAMSGSAIATTGDTGSIKTYICWTVRDADQGVDERAFAVHTLANAGTTSLPLVRVADSLTVMIAYASTAFELTLANPSRVTSVNDDGTTAKISIGYAADTERSIAATYANYNDRAAALVVNIGPVLTEPSINPTGTDKSITAGATHSVAFQNLTSPPASIAIVNGETVAPQSDFVYTPDAEDATKGTATFTGTLGNLPYGTSGYSYLVTCADDSEITFDIDSLSPAAGRDYVVAVDPVSDETGILYVWDEGGPVTGDQVGWPVLVDGVTTTIRPDFTFYGETETTFPDSITLDIDYWDSVTSTRYYRGVEVAFSEDGEGTVIGITSRGFTAEGFTVRGFTARGF